MKRKLLIIPIVFLLFTSCIIPFSSSAAASDDYPGLPSVSDVASRYGSYDSYLYFNAVYSSNSIYGFYIDLTNDTPSYSSGVLSAYGIGRQISYTRSDESSEFRDTGRSTFNRSFTFDFNNLTTSLTDLSPIFNVVLVLNGETVFDSDSIEFGLDVSFNLPLSGDVDRIGRVYTLRPSGDNSFLDDDGKWDTSGSGTWEEGVVDHFSINVKNNSPVGVQVFMAIVPKGESITFYSSSDYYSGLTSTTNVAAGYNMLGGSANYVWISKEWNYFYNSSIAHFNEPTMTLDSKVFKHFSNVPWHFVPPESEITHSFNYSEINLEPYVEYDVLVYAIDNPYDSVSRQSAIPLLDYYLDFSNIFLAYSSTFRIVNPYVYNPGGSKYGNLTYNESDVFQDMWKSSGYIDPSTGETFIKDMDFNDFSSNQNLSPRPDHFSSSGSSSSYNNLLGQSSGVFRFFSSLFGYLPGSFTTVINLALWSMLIFALIRRIT